MSKRETATLTIEDYINCYYCSSEINTKECTYCGADNELELMSKIINNKINIDIFIRNSSDKDIVIIHKSIN